MQEKITHFRGVNLQSDATLIANNSASKMLNMQLDSVGTLQRFLGYTRALNLGEKPINGFYHFGNKILVAQGNRIFEFEEGEI
jgi:hypothetical protein